MSKAKVLIVDDSALVRQVLTEMLASDPALDVVGTANDPYEAREKIKSLKPDVLTLDIEMPKMDGVTFLKNLMRLHPLPVVMISTLTAAGADITLEALDLGAVDFVTKPQVDQMHSLEDYREEITEKVRAAASVNRYQLESAYARYAKNKLGRDASSLPTHPSAAFGKQSKQIIALGASTGGTEAIKEVLIRLPADCPAMVITQHIPATFSLPFAKRMDSVSEVRVHHAKDGQLIQQGNVYIAPGDKHLMIEKIGAKFVCRLNDGPPVNRHKPAVDVMFRSVLQTVGSNSIGVLLTGMGADGAKGLKALQDISVPTIAQDEKTSVVWGMPGEAVKLGAADQILPLDQVSAAIMALVK